MNAVGSGRGVPEFPIGSVCIFVAQWGAIELELNANDSDVRGSSAWNDDAQRLAALRGRPKRLNGGGGQIGDDAKWSLFDNDDAAA